MPSIIAIPIQLQVWEEIVMALLTIQTTIMLDVRVVRARVCVLCVVEREAII